MNTKAKQAERPTAGCPVCGSADPLTGPLHQGCQVCADHGRTALFLDGEWVTLLSFPGGAWVRLALRGDVWIVTHQGKARMAS